MITAESCHSLDSVRPVVAAAETASHLPPDVVYLDGNSLGPQVRSMPRRIEALLDQWRSSLIEGWFEHDWVNLPVKVGAKLEPIIGAEPGSVIACDSTTVNLFKAAEAACRWRGGDLLTDAGNFPTDLYVLAEVARRNGREFRVVGPEELVVGHRFPGGSRGHHAGGLQDRAAARSGSAHQSDPRVGRPDDL